MFEITAGFWLRAALCKIIITKQLTAQVPLSEQRRQARSKPESRILSLSAQERSKPSRNRPRDAEKPAQHDALHMKRRSRTEALVSYENVSACQNLAAAFVRIVATTSRTKHETRASAVKK